MLYEVTFPYNHFSACFATVCFLHLDKLTSKILVLGEMQGRLEVVLSSQQNRRGDAGREALVMWRLA